MRRPLSLSVSALALCALAAPAFAEVDAAAVWEDLKAGAEAWGYEVDAGAVDIGSGDVSATDVTFTYETTAEVPVEDDPLLPPGTEGASGETRSVTSTMVVTLPTLRITEDGAGAVVELPASMPFEMTAVPADAPDETGGFGGTITQDGMRITVTEEGGGMLYDYAAGAMDVVLDRVSGPEAPEVLDARMRLEQLAGQSRVGETSEGHRQTDQTMSAARMTLSLDVEDAGDAAEDGGDLALAVAIADVSGTGSAVLPEGIDSDDMSAALRAGLAVKSDLTLGAARSELEFTGPDGTMSYASNSLGGALSIAMDADTVRYAVSSNGGDASVIGSQIPLPEVTYSYGSARFDVTIPSTADGESKPFASEIELREIRLGDPVWSLFDPQGVLPREPATLAFTMSGTARFLQGVFDLAGGAMPSGEPPELETLNIDNLEIALAGAALLGNGTFTGTPGAAPVAPGLPPVEGKIELSATGINGLMEDLTQLGLLMPQQGAMVRGMLGFIARSTGDDSYATEIEIGPDGIKANGVPLQ